jgi:Resolvase, N terminal domain/Recombinase/Recombinase zinc beta ribbon domain
VSSPQHVSGSVVKARRARRPAHSARKPLAASKVEVRPGRRWVIYVRQSKKRKNQRGEVTTISIELQEQECRRTIANLDPAPISITVIKDHGRRGVRGHHRPGREELLLLVEADEADAVMAFKASRIGRDIEESENLWNRCQVRGAFVAATDCLDLSDPLVRAIYFGQAAQGSVERSSWSLGAAQTRRSRGLAPNKSCPAFGMRWDDEELTTDPAEFPVVERIFKLFDDGVGAGEIAQRLTKERAPRRGVAHSQWDRQAVTRILRTTWYVGLVPDRDAFWSCGRTFIDVDLWNRCSGRIQVMDDTKRGFSRALSGLLYCDECGGWSPMSLCYSRKKRKDGSVLRRDRYRCIHAVRDKQFCKGQSIDSEAVELHLVDQIREALGTDELAKTRLRRRISDAAKNDVTAGAEHEAAITRLCTKELDLFNRRESGEVIPDHIYNAQMTQLGTERQSRERKLERAAGSRKLQAATLRRMTAELESDPLDPDNWMKLPAARRNDFLRLMFPHGVAVARQFSGKSRKVDTRLRPRNEEDTERSRCLHEAEDGHERT